MWISSLFSGAVNNALATLNFRISWKFERLVTNLNIPHLKYPCIRKKSLIFSPYCNISDMRSSSFHHETLHIYLFKFAGFIKYLLFSCALNVKYNANKTNTMEKSSDEVLCFAFLPKLNLCFI